MTPTTLKSESGFEISYRVRFGRFLTINTNFNPMNAKEFLDKHLLQVPGVIEVFCADVAPDGNGYIILQLRDNCNMMELHNGLEKEFINYFMEI